MMDEGEEARVGAAMNKSLSENRQAPFRRAVSRARRLFAVGAVCVAAAASALGQSEEGVKAAFLYNFGKFAAWPQGALADGNALLTVGFVGADALADVFEKNVAGKNVNGRDVAVRKLSDAAGAEKCQIVYVGDASQAAAVLAAVKDRPILTVGEGDAFAAAGGMIRFVREGAKVSFDLDLQAAKAVKLELDQKVRQIARNVKGG
jgi:hypothetical protein